ncbi:MAG: glycosyltransferase family 9 protein [Verrucomicrobiae bacterium]|nr:glycosyltransferase family 9 protein [Verrucomicrobiae bacterium]NNJ42525.1 glycosyltransferase family 9 protein [Akkermansiaceae bacterium]
MKILITEIWGLGDAVLATGAIRRLIEQGHDVGILCKPSVRELLEDRLPVVKWHVFTFPWTAHRNKYQFWKWPWSEMAKIRRSLSHEKYDAAVSVRADPRDDALAWLAGIKRRIGFRRWPHWKLVNEHLGIGAKRHRVESWEKVASYLCQENVDGTPELDSVIGSEDKLVLHVGASVSVRRWPIEGWRELATRVKQAYPMAEIDVIQDFDGYGSELSDIVDHVYDTVNLNQMVDILSSAKVVIGNDSGPTHIAASVGTPTLTIFGPQLPELFRPWNDKARYIEGKPCQYKPCKDYCRFSKAHCIQDIDAQQVFDVLSELLRQSEQSENTHTLK